MIEEGRDKPEENMIKITSKSTDKGPTSYSDNQKTLKQEDDFIEILAYLLDVFTKQLVFLVTYLIY